MNSRALPTFWARFHKLPPKIQAKARKAFQAFQRKSDDPALRFKKLEGFERFWSVRIDVKYRAVGERRGKLIVWIWIGSHSQFDKEFGN